MNYREKVIRNYAAWTATAALRSGKHIKDGFSLQNALEEVVVLADIPSTQTEFDLWHERVVPMLQKKVLELRSTNDEKEFSVGWSAKLLNVYLKTLYYVGDLEPSDIRKVIHPPIDNILVDSIIEEYGVSIWSYENKFTIQGIEKYDVYSEMIKRLKQIANKSNLENLIDIEHVWSSINKKSSNKVKYNLHDAMVDALKAMTNRQGSFQEVADRINQMDTYQRKDKTPVKAFQIEIRATLSQGRYSHLFKRTGNDQLMLND